MNPVFQLIAEAKKNSGDFQKVGNVPESKDLVFFKFLMSISNLHESIADLYEMRGDKAKSKWHQQMSDKLRSEANQEKSK